MSIQGIEKILNENEINFKTIEQGVYVFCIPNKFSANIEKNLRFYNVNDLVVSAEMQTRMASEGVQYLHAPKSTATLKRGEEYWQLHFVGPFKTGYFLIERLLTVV